MTVVEYYILFCLTTSIYSLIDLFGPAIGRASADGIKNEITENPKLSIVIFFLINFIIAPLLFPILMVPSLTAKALTGLEKVLREPNKEI